MKIPVNTEIEVSDKNIEETLVQRLSKTVESKMFSVYSRRMTEDMEAIVTKAVTDMLDENKDRIIDEAVKIVAAKVSRSKAIKERLAIALEEVDLK